MKKITTILLVNLFMFSLLNNLHSQSQVIEKCGFDRLRNILLQDSNYLRKEIEAEQKIAQYISQSQLRSSSSIYTIPVVVHVLHLGELLGVGTNISDAQIQSAITNLNDVYRGQTAGSPVDFEIEFALAQQDPNCMAHSGINRINASSVPNYSSGGVDYYSDGGEADQDVLKNLSRWPETEYFNIWIVSEIENNNGGFGIQGYANFFTGSAMEGSVMMASVFGFDPTSAQSSFNLNAPRDNSTVVHEIGHYLHLHHTFKGDGDADDDGIGDACPGDVTIGVDSDGCTDTEPHKRYTSQCKSGLLNDCIGATFGDNTAKNFMSYASCQDRLTSDQKTRSRAMLATSGISLIYSKGDEAPIISSGSLANANCIPQSSSTATSGGYGGIMNFTIINEFSASSSNTQNDGGYVDYTSNCLNTISLEEDSTYNFELTTWYNGHDFKGYIDFNNDGDFLDANEEVFSGANPPNVNGTNGTNTSTGSGTLTIPIADGINVLANTPLRLRIVSELTSVNGTITDACYNPFYAQAEDYQLVINQSAVTLTADFSASDSTLCQVTSVTFTDLSTGNPTSWAWDFGDGNSSTLQNPTHTYASVGTYDVSLTVTTSTGSDSETKTGFITVNSNPNINAGIDQTICDGISTTLNATSGQNYVTEVTAAGSSDYILSGAFSGNDPAINISLGDTLTFNVNSPGHPFLIKTTNTTGTANAVTVTNNGTSSGTIIWSPNSVGTYYYICEYHAGMVGTITVGASNVNYTWSNNITNGTTFTPTSTNTYTVIGTDGNGCFSTDNVTVNLIPNSTGIDVITACDSLIWIDGITYSASNNTATYTLTNAAGCDSVVTLDLTIINSTTGTDLITACHSYTWIDGNTYTSNINTATFTLQTANGCDSVVILDLTINNSTTGTDLITACDSYTWIDGNTYNSNNNTATFTLQTANGCDSVVSLNLTIISGSLSEETISACDSLVWSVNGNTYTQSGIYYDSIQSSNGCDSVYKLDLTIYQSSNTTDLLTQCDSLIWIDGITYTASNNTATYTLNNADGCDSLVTLNLTVNYSSTSLVTESSCNSYSWNGQTLSASGIYVDTNVNAAGCPQHDSLDLTITTTPNISNEVVCDSFAWNGNSYTTSGTYTSLGTCVDTLNLVINNSSSSTSSLSSCGDISWNGSTYTATGIYSFITTNSVGCDSTATLDLTIDSTVVSQVNATACDSYSWNSNSYSVSGNYTDTLSSSAGCDSIVTLNLTIDSSFNNTLNEVACDSYSWNGTAYTTGGTYYDSLQTSNGCDSVITLNLTINNSHSSVDSITACSSYFWNGTSYTQSGTYYDSLQTLTGCDSILGLNLIIDSAVVSQVNVTACDSYSWNSNTYSMSGNYTVTLSTSAGCDSIVTLNLTINNSFSSVDSITACNSYLWSGTSYTQSGTYYDSLQRVTGCDSILVLNLIIDSAVVSQVNATACDSYSWNNSNYFASGTYIDTLSTSAGCDSIVTLILTINNSFSSVDTISSCNNYSWNGNMYSQSGTYLDTLQSISGCDSIASLQLTILESYIIEDSVSSCGSFLWNGVLIDSSGTFTDTLQSIAGCDSINILYLDVNDNTSAPLTIELLLDDYCLETFWTVKDSQDSIWYSEGPYDCNPSGGGNQANTTIIKDIYLEENECYTFELNDVYGDGLSASLWNGTDGNWTLQDLNGNIVSQGQGDFGFITANSFYVSQSTPSFINEKNSKLEVLVYPNPFSKTTTVRIINGKEPYLLELIDIRGRVVKSLSSNQEEFQLYDINSNSGIYWLKIKNQSNFKPIKLVIE